ncbi:DegT/DnrJ/EryC1/StrS family aminotransferase, partial [Serratia marcescens]
ALARHAGEVAVLLPYDTFGTCIDLARYARLSEQHDIGVVVDAAASLGSLDAAGRGFGTGARFASVFSMHATKTFATAEGGLI